MLNVMKYSSRKNIISNTQINNIDPDKYFSFVTFAAINPTNIAIIAIDNKKRKRKISSDIC